MLKIPYSQNLFSESSPNSNLTLRQNFYLWEFRAELEFCQTLHSGFKRQKWKKIRPMKDFCCFGTCDPFLSFLGWPLDWSYHWCHSNQRSFNYCLLKCHHYPGHICESSLMPFKAGQERILLFENEHMLAYVILTSSRLLYVLHNCTKEKAVQKGNHSHHSSSNLLIFFSIHIPETSVI